MLSYNSNCLSQRYFLKLCSMNVFELQNASSTVYCYNYCLRGQAYTRALPSWHNKPLTKSNQHSFKEQKFQHYNSLVLRIFDVSITKLLRMLSKAHIKLAICGNTWLVCSLKVFEQLSLISCDVKQEHFHNAVIILYVKVSRLVGNKK